MKTLFTVQCRIRPELPANSFSLAREIPRSFETEAEATAWAYTLNQGGGLEPGWKRITWASVSKHTFRIGSQGELRWVSVDRCISPSTCAELALPVGNPEAQKRVSDDEVTAAIDAYRAHRAEQGYSAEERAEMKAAFGSEPVVDVLTGRRIK